MRNLILIFIGLATSAFSWADDLDRAPISFNTPHGKAIFIDLKKATYNIDYDLQLKKAAVTAKLEFLNKEKGLPIFDLYSEPETILLDGLPVNQILIESPDNITKFRIILKEIQPGNHVLEIKFPHLEEFTKYVNGGVLDSVITDDYADRAFLEYFLPANLEYDQVKMTFNYTFKKAEKEQRFYTNGSVRKHSLEAYTIEFPETYNCSSIFIKIAPVGLMNEIKFDYELGNGTLLPIVIFSEDHSLDLMPAKNETLRVLADLQKDYGPFPHPALTVEYQGEGGGGMEYAGAAMSGLEALDHEIMHNYFARGIMPANGNAGWFDEAIAYWYEAGYPRSSHVPAATNDASISPYIRMTTLASLGVQFMSYLDFRFSSQGGLKPFLRYLIDTQTFKPYTTEDIIKLMSDFYGEDVSADFYLYVYQDLVIQ